MRINIIKPVFHFHAAPPAMASALFAALQDAGEQPATTPPSGDTGRPEIGEYWEGQGGIYAGDFRGDDGVTFGLIVAKEQDIGRARWAPDGERDLSDWDGLANTARLRKECPAAELAAKYECDGHSDFYLPARRELNFAGATLHGTFGKDSWYWTSTPHAESYAWAVDFERGLTSDDCRRFEFRVRPVRRFVY